MAVGNGAGISKALTAKKYSTQPKIQSQNDNEPLPFISLGQAVADVLTTTTAKRYGISRPLARVVVGILTDGRVTP